MVILEMGKLNKHTHSKAEIPALLDEMIWGINSEGEKPTGILIIIYVITEKIENGEKKSQGVLLIYHSIQAYVIYCGLCIDCVLTLRVSFLFP